MGTAGPAAERLDGMKRGKTIQYAVYAALASKGSSALIQLLALPLAARVLGREEFGIYSTVTLSIFTLTLLQFGVGPALTRSIAESSARNRRSMERHFYQHGGILMISLAAIFSGILGGIFSFAPLDLVFGSGFLEWESELRVALLVGLALLAGEIVMWHTDAVRQGYLEAHLMHGFSCIGNLLGGVIIIFGLGYFPSIPFLLLATFLPNILARLISTFFLWKKRPYLISKRSYFRWKTLERLWRDGISFSATTDLVFLIEVTACGFLIARILGPGEVAIYQVFVSFTAIFRRIVETVGGPFWTASINAKVRCERDWIRSAARRFYTFYLVMITLGTAFMITFGPFLVSLLYGPEFQLGRGVFAAQMAFLAMLGWRDVNRYILIGSGKLSQTVAPVMQGLIISLSLAIAGLLYSGMELMYVGLALGIALVPGWRLAVQVFDCIDLSNENKSSVLAVGDPGAKVRLTCE